MGDRNNPIKFGPEWLRNLSRERNASNPGSMNQSGALGAAGAPRPGSPPPGHPLNAAASTSQKIHLANLRYGREEMLALYDRTVEAPTELKSIDQLYQPRGKPPFALHNTFEEDMRENLRSGGAPIGGVMTPERFGMGRGLGRGLAVADSRGRPRMPFVRQPSLGRGNAYHPRIPGYGPSAEEEAAAASRSWGATNGSPSANRNANEQAEWAANKTYRSKRPTNNTNWRSPQTREEGEEWRLSDPGRPRTGPQEKWERDWGDRPNQEKPPLWNTNRRTWGGDAQNEENLPEWAMDNAEACAGTFDSSGAFHGYSNDDSNLPKNQEASYSLTRSHTHGSFARLKSVEDGSEEWWASAKAKKLSPKKFDASDIKFKKQMSMPAGDETGNNSSSKLSGNSKEESNASHETQENLVTSPDSSDSGQAENTFSKNNAYRPKFSENKTFDALMRSDINMDEASDERGNFQSVTIKPNNSLRQKHQNIVASAADNPNQQVRKGMQEVSASQSAEQEISKLSAKSPEDKMVEDIFEITLDDKDILSKMPSVIGLPLNTSSAGISPSKVSMVNSMPHGSSPGVQKRVSSPNPASHGNVIHTQSLSMVGPGMHPSSMHALGLHTTGTKAPGMQPPGVHSHGLQTATMHSGMPVHGLPSPSAQVSGIQTPGMQNSALQTLGLQPSGSKNAGMPSPGMHTQGLMASGMQSHGMQMPGIQAPGMQALGLQSLGMQPGMQSGSNQTSAMQNIGISNAALNSAMRLQGPRLIEQGHSNNSMGIPLQRMSPPALLLNPGMANSPMGASGMHPGSPAMAGFPNSPSMQGMASANNSLFGLGQNPNNTQMPPSNDIQMPNHGQSNMFPLHGLQHSGSQGPFSSLYGNMMRHSPPQNNPSSQSLADHWYYEDPKKNIQGPFASKEMYNWYRAGFFSPNLMVRRACDTHMRPLGSYGTMVPFAQMDMAGFPIGGGFGMHNQGSHDSVMNSQSGLGLDVDSLWSQTSTSPELMWMQQSMNARNDMRVNNLPMIFWDQQSSAVTSNSLLPEEMVKMKTEDQILAQLRASQSAGSVPNMPFISDQSNVPIPAPIKPEEEVSSVSATPNLEELHKLIQKDTLNSDVRKKKSEMKEDVQNKAEKSIKLDPPIEIAKPTEPVQTKQQDVKQAKQKAEVEKVVKTKDSKSKNKKVKEEKKDDTVETGSKEDELNKPEKKPQDLSPSKSKKDDKSNKKDLEKEKKEWIKEGFTIVKGSEKNAKEKKKTEEVKTAEEAERKRKEEEKLATEEEKKKKQTEPLKKQQEQKQQQRQASEAVTKKAPWSTVSAQAQQATSQEGPTLAEIQRLEREKKLEQMKEQQQMMQAIAQQQAAALAREHEMQAGLGWAKKKPSASVPGLTLAEIQAEARQQSAAAAAAAEAAAAAAAQAAQALEEVAMAQPNHVPWGNTHNGGGGFWDSPSPVQSSKTVDKVQEMPRVPEQGVKIKKKNTLNVPAKKEASPVAEFDTWCNTVLASWSAKIDVPTFVGFLKDIESPYEVKDYVKCYLGETRESSEFSRQFLEKRSKLLRVGMVTPSDDLCSPAVAVNPRTTSGSDYQEVKGKGKKTKKNKMLKIDARILGFSVTAAEDRINVGDIDSV